MKCQFCGYENERGAAFCENCGQKLSPQSGKETKAKEKKQRQPRPAKEPRPPRQKKESGKSHSGPGGSAPSVCPVCGTENEPGTAFCNTCGSPLPRHPEKKGSSAAVIIIIISSIVLILAALAITIWLFMRKSPDSQSSQAIQNESMTAGSGSITVLTEEDTASGAVSGLSETQPQVQPQTQSQTQPPVGSLKK